MPAPARTEVGSKRFDVSATHMPCTLQDVSQVWCEWHLKPSPRFFFDPPKTINTHLPFLFIYFQRYRASCVPHTCPNTMQQIWTKQHYLAWTTASSFGLDPLRLVLMCAEPANITVTWIISTVLLIYNLHCQSYLTTPPGTKMNFVIAAHVQDRV